VEWSGVEWNGVEWSGVEWSGVEWNGVEWNDTDGLKRKCLKIKLSDCHFTDQKSRTDLLGFEAGPKTKINLNCVQRSSPYRAVNALRL
jgi:hypothetical protein